MKERRKNAMLKFEVAPSRFQFRTTESMNCGSSSCGG